MSEEAVNKLQIKWRNENYDGNIVDSPNPLKKSDKIQSLNLSNTLTKIIDQTNFYQETKKGKPISKENAPSASKFDQHCFQKRELVIPSFVEIENHELFLAE